MAERFLGKVVVVVGGTSGIGATAALRFAEEGASVVIGGRSERGGTETLERILTAGGAGRFVRTDVTSATEVKALIDAAVEEFGQLDCAFNNAGWEGVACRTAEVEPADWLKMIDVKLNGVWRSMKCEIPAMQAAGAGAIVNMAGNWGLVGAANYSAYCAAAHGVMGLTKAAAKEYAAEGIRINAVCPGAVDAPILDRMVGGDEAVKRSFGDYIAMGRICTPEEVAEAVLWLCSDAASYVTGTGLVIDGGG